MSIEANLFVYKISKIHKVYDGDTFTVDIDLGFNMLMCKKSIRLYGINTPEIRGDQKMRGVEVRDYVKELLYKAKELYLISHKDKSGKYGRILATVILLDELENELSLNDHLLDMGMAEPYMI